MAFTGKYELKTQENFENFMTLLGYTDKKIEEERDGKIMTEIEQNGKQFTWKTILPLKTWTNKFTIGQVSELESMQGIKNEISANLYKGKVRILYDKYSYSAQIVEDKLVETYAISGLLGSVTMKRTSTRV